MTVTELLTIDEAAEYLRRPKATLYFWRSKQVGPPSANLQGRVMFRRSDLDAWIEAQFSGTAA